MDLHFWYFADIFEPLCVQQTAVIDKKKWGSNGLIKILNFVS